MKSHELLQACFDVFARGTVAPDGREIIRVPMLPTRLLGQP